MVFRIRFLLAAVVITAVMLSGNGGSCPFALAESGQLELEQKIADLNLLSHQLEDRMQQAQGLRTALADQQAVLTSEIHDLLKNLPGVNLQQAQQNLRIRYDIDLLATVLSYIDKLDAKLNFYQDGRDRLDYLRRSAEDDVHMIAALNDLKIDALTTQISLVVNRYLPEAHVIQIDPQQVKPLSDLKVWDAVRSSGR
jgi:chromosome segregation ATPase